MIDQAALDAAIRRFPTWLPMARVYGPRSILNEKALDMIRLEYRLVCMERAGVVPGKASR